MMLRNQMINSVFWPNGKSPKLQLVDDQGEVVATVPVIEPIRGSDLARMTPEGFAVDFVDVFAATTKGKRFYGECEDFDSAVVPVRATVSLEDRLNRLERRERNTARLLAEAREREAASVVEDEPAPEPASEPAPEPVSEPVPEPAPDAEVTNA